MKRIITAAGVVLALAACGDRTAPDRPKAAEMPAGPPVPSASRSFHDWYAVCDNGNACVGYTGEAAGWIRVGIEPGPDGKPSVRLGVWPDDGNDIPRPITLVIDGQSHATQPGPEDTSSAMVAEGEVAAVITQLAAARSIVLRSGDQTAEMPTHGAAAAFLWFDERQGRLDTVTALVRKGARPASAVPAAPALPIVIPAPAVSQAGFETPNDPLNAEDEPRNAVLPATIEALPAVKECRKSTDFNEYLQKAVTGARLDGQTELWGVPCDGGAYNFSYAFYRTGPNGANPRQIIFNGSDGKPMSDEEYGGWLVNPVYDPQTRTLSHFPKSRGLGDCGVIQTWTWTGSDFVLSREQTMSDCWGMVSDLWPTTWRTR